MHNIPFSFFRMAASDDSESPQWLQELLAEVQLEQFYVKLRDNLQVTRYVGLFLFQVAYFCTKLADFAIMISDHLTIQRKCVKRNATWPMKDFSQK